MAIPELGVDYQKAKEELESIDRKGNDYIHLTLGKIDNVYHKEKEKIENIAAKNKERQEKELTDFALKKTRYDQYLRNQQESFNIQQQSKKEELTNKNIQFENEQTLEKQKLQEELKEREAKLKQRDTNQLQQKNYANYLASTSSTLQPMPQNPMISPSQHQNFNPTLQPNHELAPLPELPVLPALSALPDLFPLDQ